MENSEPFSTIIIPKPLVRTSKPPSKIFETQKKENKNNNENPVNIDFPEQVNKSKGGIHFQLECSNSQNDNGIKQFSENRSTSARYIILFLTISCLTFVMSNIVCFNFTILCMPASHRFNSSSPKLEPYNHQERTWLFSAVAIGALIAVVPVSHAISKLGCRNVFFSAGILTSISTGMIPIGSEISLEIFFALRVLQGVSFATCMPTVGSVTSSWASLQQQGLFIAVLTTFGQLSSVISMPVAGQLCTSMFGWQSVFYLHAVLTAIVFGIWFYFFTDTPEINRRVSTNELSIINANKSVASLGRPKESIPYLEIVTTPSIWAVWVGALGDLVAVQLIHTFSPLYIKNILGYSVTKTGFAAALPVLLQFCVKVTAGHSSDIIKGISETTKLRIFNSIALGASAIFLAACSYVKQGQGFLGLILISLATAMFGFNGGGFNKCATLVSRQYSPFVMANIQFIWCLSMLICPILVSFLLQNSTVEEWRLVFFAHSGILVLTNVFFCVFATAKPASWTDRTIKKAAKKNRSILETSYV